MLKSKINSGKFVLGTWCDLPSPEAVNVIAKAGLDFVIIDMEHGPADFRTAQLMVMAAETDGCEAIIRVSRNDESDILRALDTGAGGIIVPHIEDVAQKDIAVNFSKFPPIGSRGLNPYTRWADYHPAGREELKRVNRDTLLALILEGQNGLKNLDAIIDDKNIDVIYIGTYDLSVALGVPGEVNSEKVAKALKAAVRKIRSKGKAAGCMIHNQEELLKFKKLGIQFITYKVETGVIYEAYRSMKNRMAKW